MSSDPDITSYGRVSSLSAALAAEGPREYLLWGGLHRTWKFAHGPPRLTKRHIRQAAFRARK